MMNNSSGLKRRNIIGKSDHGQVEKRLCDSFFFYFQPIQGRSHHQTFGKAMRLFFDQGQEMRQEEAKRMAKKSSRLLGSHWISLCILPGL